MRLGVTPWNFEDRSAQSLSEQACAAETVEQRFGEGIRIRPQAIGPGELDPERRIAGQGEERPEPGIIVLQGGIGQAEMVDHDLCPSARRWIIQCLALLSWCTGMTG